MKHPEHSSFLKDGFKLKVLGPNELDQIFPAVEQFFSETRDWDYLTFDPEKAKRRLLDSVEYGYARVVAGFDQDGNLSGFVVVSYDDNFTVEKVGLVYAIYVLPEYRRTALPRQLINGAEAVAKFDGAVNLHAHALNHLPRGGKSFLNLLSKRGFVPYAGGACKRL